MSIKILTGDCRDILKTLPSQSVQMVCTSPPYFGLRDYGVAGQIGLEPTPAAFVAEMVGVFRQVWRVLRDDGTVWLNLGDSFASGHGGSTTAGNYIPKNGSEKPATPRKREDVDCASWSTRDVTPKRVIPGLKPKDLMGIPWRVAFALQDDGWYLRRDIIWAKPNPMPESCTDRPATAHEYVFLLTKRARYFYDAEAIKEPGTIPAGTKGAKGSAERFAMEGVNSRPPEYKVYDGTRNARSVWTITTQPFSEAHFATFPPKLAETCILAGTSEHGACRTCGAPWERMVEKLNAPPEVFTGRAAPTDGMIHSGMRVGGEMKGSGQKLQDWRAANPPRTTGWQPTCTCPPADPVPCVVLDPFAGACTSLLVADRLGRDAIGIELNPEYAAMGRRRIEGDAGLFAQVTQVAAE